MKTRALCVLALLVAGLMISGCNFGARDNGTGNAADMGKPNIGNAPPPDTTVK